jgi:hypothetical protein
MADKEVKMVEARVLVDGAHGKVNDVVTVTESEAANAGDLDPNPSAVAYAKAEAAKAAAKKAEQDGLSA